jgi:hypothetical protein
VLASVFAANGGYESPAAFNDGVVAALPVAVAVLTAGFLIALAVPGAGRRRAGAGEPEAAPAPA